MTWVTVKRARPKEGVSLLLWDFNLGVSIKGYYYHNEFYNDNGNPITSLITHWTYIFVPEIKKKDVV